MTVFLITYDLNKETVRPKIVDKIKDFGSWARLSESSYAVDTTLTSDQVYDRFKQILDSNDHLLVIRLSKPWCGRNSQEVIDWLTPRLLSQ
ncbi:hypothetical protein [Paracoccus onubensis]|uniref:Uncharacterized protein n=1 Tax=Paracoccus onubensis TaxID=1675788 RepID=A0A418SSR3_9RHOB|nr:hypothetical protein [Paracoccus onubensis]RJE84011.1 hypothetical protein D3P04_13420 [Paracoccus onubensis]